MTDYASRNARIPPRHHKRRLTISKHAIERFRERVDEEFRHRDDDDLGNLLDERIAHAESNYEVRDPRAPDEITTLRSVACRHTTYWAVIRASTVVTVLDEEMAKNNFNGQWATVLNTPFAALRDLKLPPVVVKMEGKKAVVQNQPELAKARAQAALALPRSPDPLEEAGVLYARARKRAHAATQTIAVLRAELECADVELREATHEVEKIHQRLLELAEGTACP